MRVYLAPKVLVIDEVGYLPLDDLGATIFFSCRVRGMNAGSIIRPRTRGYGDFGIDLRRFDHRHEDTLESVAASLDDRRISGVKVTG